MARLLSHLRTFIKYAVPEILFNHTYHMPCVFFSTLENVSYKLFESGIIVEILDIYGMIAPCSNCCIQRK